MIKGASVRGTGIHGHAGGRAGDAKRAPRHLTGIGQRVRVVGDAGSGEGDPELAREQGRRPDAGRREDVELQVVGGADGIVVAGLAAGGDERGAGGDEPGLAATKRGKGNRKGDKSAMALDSNGDEQLTLVSLPKVGSTESEQVETASAGEARPSNATAPSASALRARATIVERVL